MAIDNKVKFGLSNFHVAPITSTTEAGVPTYGSPIKVPGSVSISLSKEVAKSIFYADNGAYYSLRNNRGYNGDYTLASNKILENKEFQIFYNETRPMTEYNGETAEVYANNYKFVATVTFDMLEITQNHSEVFNK